MSSLNLSDEHISMAYDALAHDNPLRWFLLAYGNKPNQLSLCASGTGDVEELTSHLTPGNVHYGLFREQSFHVALSYIPDSVSGVKRARALVHARTVHSQFKAHQMLNVSNPDQFTVDALRSALRLPPRGAQRSALLGLGIPPRSTSISRKPSSGMRSASLFTSSTPSNSNTPQAHQRSTSSPLASADFDAGVSSSNHVEDLPDSVLSTPSAIKKPTPPHLANISTADQTDSPIMLSTHTSPALQSAFSVPSSPGSGVTNGTQSPQSPFLTSWRTKQESPLPPPPPEDPVPRTQPHEQRVVDDEPNSSDERPISPHIGSIPDSKSVASLHSSVHSRAPPSPPHRATGPNLPPSNGTSSRPPERRREGTVDGLPGPSLSSPSSPQLDSPPRTASQEEAFRLRSRWAVGKDVQASLPQQDDNPDLQAPQRAHSKFQARVVTASGQEDERRLVVLDEERRRRAAERARREKEERGEEEARQREFEERKERDRKKRWELARKAEERRIEQQRRQEEEEKRQKEEKARKEEEAREKRSHIQRRFEKQKGLDLLTGFITLESSSSWKRRYFRLSTEDWVFFKNDKEVTHPVHAIELHHIRGLREWDEGYEELEAIPHSFAVELQNGRPCLFFADSAEDKEVLLGLLNQAAGL